MNAHTENVTIIKDTAGNPAFAVVPFADWQAIILGKEKHDALIPSEVVNYAMDNDVSALAAWRHYLSLTQVDVAKRMNISQPAYAQLEAKTSLRKSTREKAAKVLGILQEQLDW